MPGNYHFMRSRLSLLLQNVLSSLWFVPSLIVLALVALAFAGIELDIRIKSEQLKTWPALFGAEEEGSRSMLSAIAGSMITVLGVTFSITMVTLSLASNQYTPRILRNFMNDRVNQVVLGVLAGIFMYCLVVLRTIRGGEERGFIPSISVAFSVVLALVGIGFLILFIHHISTSIQASSIIPSIAGETLKAVDHLFPKELGEELSPEALPPEPDESIRRALQGTGWTPILALKSGYIQGLDADTLLKLAQSNQAIVRMEYRVGEFVVEGTPLVSLSHCRFASKEVSRTVNKVFTLNRYRTVPQDAAYGIHILVDIALKALSPGVNDTTTATICIDYLSAILARLTRRSIEEPYRLHEGKLRVIAKGPSFERLVHLSFDQIRQNAEGNVTVVRSLLRMVEVIAKGTRNRHRQHILLRQVDLLADTVSRSVPSGYDRVKLEEYLEQVRAELLGNML